MNSGAGKAAFRAASILICTSALMLGAPLAHSASVEPTPLADDLGQCREQGPWTELKVEPLSDGTFTAGDLEVTVAGFDGQSFSFSANIGVDAVLVKGDDTNTAHGYFYDPETLGDTDLRAPLKNGNLQPIENARFCFDLDDQQPLPNPPLPDSCGFDIALMLDVSGSIDDEELVFYKDAAKSYVDAVGNSPSRIQLSTFNATAQVVVPYIDVRDPAGAQTVKDAIDTIDGDGNTNWDHAFRVNDPDEADVETPQIAIIITDGKPTTWGSPPVGRAEEDALRAGVRSANGLKMNGTRIIGVGVSFDRAVLVDNLKMVSGPTENSDYFLADDFEQLADVLAQTAPAACGAQVTVRKLVDGVPTEGWSITSSVTPEGDNPATTDADGEAVFDYGNTEQIEVDLTETLQEGFTFAGAACTSDGETYPSESIELGVRLTLSVSAVVVCEFNNESEPAGSPLIVVEKIADPTTVDLTDGDTSNDTVAYTITVTNIGDASGQTGPIVDDYDQAHVTVSNISDAGVDDGDTITWEGIALGPNSSKSFTYDGTIHGPFALDAPKCGETEDFSVINTVTVDDATASEEVCVPAGPAPSLLKQVRILPDGAFSSGVNADPGDALEYRITYSNTGSTAATNVVVTDPVPDFSTFTSCEPAEICSEADGTITWNVGTVEADSSAVLTFQVALDETFPIGITSIGNVATATADQHPPTDSNEVVVTVTRFEKVSCPDETVVPGGFIEWTLEWGVHGRDLTGVTVEDRLPAGVDFVSASPEPTGFGPLRWEFGAVTAGTENTITIVARAPGEAALDEALTNEADLFADGVPRTTAVDTVTVSLADAVADARAYGASVELLGTEVIAPMPDTDPSGEPGELASVPAAPAAEVELLAVQEFTEVTANATRANAIATTAEVRLLQQGEDWLVTADAVRALSSSFADAGNAGSSSVGSVLTNVTINGEQLGTVTEPTTITVTDPILGTTATVSLLEKVERGAAAGDLQPVDNTFNSGLTINGIHVNVTDSAGDVQADIVVAHATSDAAFGSGLPCDDGVPLVSGTGFALSTTADETVVDPDNVLHDGEVARVLLPSTGGEESATLAHVGPVTDGTSILVESGAAETHTVGTTDIDADTADASTEAQIGDLDLLEMATEEFLLTADLIRAEASASASGVPSAAASGTAFLANVVIDGTNVCETLGLGSVCTPEPNTTLPTDTEILVVLNEHIPGPSGEAIADLTVNAVHIYILGQDNPLGLPVGAEIIIASAHADARAADALPTPPEEGGLPTTGERARSALPGVLPATGEMSSARALVRAALAA